MNQEALNAVYLFIAELNGYRMGTVTEKLAFGEACYDNNTLPEMNDDHLHEIIWLERLYTELTRYRTFTGLGGNPDEFHWEVPIELDASASMLGYMGALLGDKRLLTMVNMAGDPDALVDPWFIDGLPRKHVKAAATPMLYGSGESAMSLWASNKLDYSAAMLKTMNESLTHGALGLANLFKEFVIHNCNPKETMSIHIDKDKFQIKCNHYKRVGDAHVKYDLYDTSSHAVRRIVHTKTHEVPDLERFRSYFQTLLIHNLDSQVADKVAVKVMVKYGYCIDVHDAFIVSPIAAADVRKWYAEAMDYIYENRAQILADYFKSIGITAASMSAWQVVLDNVEPITDFKCRGEVLK